MPQINSKRKPLTAAAILVVAALALAACGGSSPAASKSTASSSGSAAHGAATSRFAAFRACLQKAGIALPAPRRTGGAPGGSRPGGFLGGNGSGGAPKLPAGVTDAQFQAAIKKCGGFGGRRFRGSDLNSAAAKRQLANYSACMRERGIALPAANTSGKGPVFDTRGLEAEGAKFAAAQSKCASKLPGLFRAHPGAGAARPGVRSGSPGAAGAPEAGPPAAGQ